jgi:glucosyl-3-phosphoglycerate phosphatase
MSIDGVLLARHGETDDNAARRFQGHRDPPLNDRGRDQARRVLSRAPAGMPVVENGSVHRL